MPIVAAIVNLIEGSLLSIYLIMHYCRGTKLNRFSWFGTIALCVFFFVNGIALLFVKEPDCENYLLFALFGVNNLLVFNITLYIGYHIYLIVYDVDQFVQNRTLATERSMSKRKMLILVVWAL